MWTNYRTYYSKKCFLSFAYWFVCVFLGVGNKHIKGRKRVLCKSWETQERFYLGRWTHEQDGEAIELAFSKKKIEERKSWLRQFEVAVLPRFLLVFLKKVNEYISNITPSACAAHITAWTNDHANIPSFR